MIIGPRPYPEVNDMTSPPFPTRANLDGSGATQKPTRELARRLDSVCDGHAPYRKKEDVSALALPLIESKQHLLKFIKVPAHG